MILRIILFLLLAVNAYALPLGPINPSGATLPATCRVGELYIDIDADTDGALYQCAVTDTWKIVGSGAGGGGDITISGTPVANDIARWTDGDTLEGRSYSEFRGDLDLEAGIDFYSKSAADILLDAKAGFGTAQEWTESQGMADDKCWQFGNSDDAQICYDSVAEALEFRDGNGDTIFEFDLVNKTIWMDPTEHPEVIGLDSDNASGDKYAGSIGWERVDDANADMYVKIDKGDTPTIILDYDESNDLWDFKSNDIKTLGDIYSIVLTEYASLSTIVGWAAPTAYILYKRVGKTVFVTFSIYGTSNSTALTFTLPYTSADVVGTNTIVMVYGKDADDGSGPDEVVDAFLVLGRNSNEVSVYTDMLGTGWTATLGKTVKGQFFYFID